MLPTFVIYLIDLFYLDQRFHQRRETIKPVKSANSKGEARIVVNKKYMEKTKKCT